MGSSVLAVIIGVLVGAPADAADWTTWGGPQRDSQVEPSEPLADSWPNSGPRRLWTRPLGEGYSAIAVRGDTLYTMYRRDAAFWLIFTPDQEVVIALDARTGKTKWQFAYDTPFRSGQAPGPHAMPQVAGNLVISVGVTGRLHALKAESGELGRTIWPRLSFSNAYSSPILISVGGRQEVVVLAAQKILGVDPHDGAMLWWRSLSTDPAMAFCSTPSWDAATYLSRGFSGPAFLTAVDVKRENEMVDP